MKNKTGALILAGGESERMNFPKAYLLHCGETFLKRIVDGYYNVGIKNICVVLNENICGGEWIKYIDQVQSTAVIVRNPNPERGRFHSFKLGIKRMLEMECCFIQNIDNPFVNSNTIVNLLENRNSYGYTVPSYRGKTGHPIVISKNIIQHTNSIMPDPNLNLRSVLSIFPRRKVDVDDEYILTNINTPDDYHRITEQREKIREGHI